MFVDWHVDPFEEEPPIEAEPFVLAVGSVDELLDVLSESWVDWPVDDD